MSNIRLVCLEVLDSLLQVVGLFWRGSENSTSIHEMQKAAERYILVVQKACALSQDDLLEMRAADRDSSDEGEGQDSRSRMREVQQAIRFLDKPNLHRKRFTGT